MKRYQLISLVVLSLGLLAGYTWAEPKELGHFCWQISPFGDTLEAEVIQEYPGKWAFRADQVSANGYRMTGGGVAVGSMADNTAAISLTLKNNHPDFFRGNTICHVQASIALPGLGGPETIACDGHLTNPPFNSQGTWVPFSCVTGPPAAMTTADTPLQGEDLP